MTDPPRPTAARLLAIALGTAAAPDPDDGEARDEPAETPHADD